MALLVVVFEPQGLQDNHRQLHASLRRKLFSMVEGLEEDTVSSNECLATKMWLPHSRSQGLARDEASGTWLACVGNPTSKDLRNASPEKVASSILRKYQTGGRDVITGLSSPFVIAMYDGAKRALNIVTDRAGLQRLYYRKIDGAHFFCSSSLVLAAARPVRLDPDSVATYFQTQYLLGTSTLFREVIKMGPAVWRTLSKDLDNESTYWRPPAESTGGSSEEWAREVVAAGVEACDTEFASGGPTTLEITGGLDSRFNLACALRTGRPFIGFTIGNVIDHDVDVARQLAKARGFEHLVVTPMKDIAETFEDDFRLIHRLSDGESDCLNVIASPSANRQVMHLRNQSVTGITGEMFRGRYYRSVGRLSGDINLRRLIDWQLRLNSGYHHDIFNSYFADPSGGRLRDVITPVIQDSQGHGGRWRADHFQFFGLVQGPAGRSMTFNNFFYRQAVPQCSNKMCDLAFAVPTALKKRSLIVRSAIAECAPDLAQVPLVSGLPARPLGFRDTCMLARSSCRYLARVRRILMAKYLRRRAAKVIYPGLQNVVNQELSAMVKRELDPDSMASIEMYDKDRLVTFLKKNKETGLSDRDQIGLVLAMELTFRYVRDVVVT